jgi:hypothetical protein
MTNISMNRSQRGNFRLKPIGGMLGALIAAPGIAAESAEREKTLGELFVSQQRESSAKRPFLHLPN